LKIKEYLKNTLLKNASNNHKSKYQFLRLTDHHKNHRINVNYNKNKNNKLIYFKSWLNNMLRNIKVHLNNMHHNK